MTSALRTLWLNVTAKILLALAVGLTMCALL